jgi:serine protease
VAPSFAGAWDVPGWVVVDLDDDLSTADVSELAEELRKDVPGLTFFPSDLAEDTRIQLTNVGPRGAAALLARVGADERVEGVEPLAWVRANHVPNDPLYAQQWHMTRAGAETAWDWGTGRGVTVAVIDTGIACETVDGFTKGTDLAGTRCVDGWNFIRDNSHANDDHGHGTHVAGTVAQSTDNGIGAAGLSFHARLMPVKVLDKGGWGNTVDIANGIRWASDHGAHVINLSLGGPRNSRVLEDAVEHARSQGTIVVAAAGNSGGSVGFPGGTAGVVGVSASDQDDRLASFSSRGKGVDIAAPGVDVIQQTVCENGKNACEIFPEWKGTSMASPHVAAAAALLVGAGISDPDAVEAELAKTARVVDDSEEGRKLFGAGIVDAGAAVRGATLRAGAVRLALLGVFALVVAGLVRRVNKSAAPLSAGYVLGGLLAGPGLFALPMLLSRSSFVVDVVSRPLGELDLLVGASLHRLLPLANVLVPLALLIVTFHVKRLRGFVAGISVGTAAFLASLPVLGGFFSPLGQPLFLLYVGGNAVLCLWLARFAMSQRTA